MKTEITEKEREWKLPSVGEPFYHKDTNEVYVRVANSVYRLFNDTNPNDTIYAVNLITGSVVSVSGNELKHIRTLKPSGGTLKFEEK